MAQSLVMLCWRSGLGLGVLWKLCLLVACVRVLWLRWAFGAAVLQWQRRGLCGALALPTCSCSCID